MTEDRDLVVALARGLAVLGTFSAESTALTVSELAQRTGLPKATVSRLTYTLSELGFLRRLPDRRSYGPGAAVLALAYPMLASLQIRQIAQPYMRELSDHARANVSLAMLDRDRLVYVETCRTMALVQDHRPDIGVIWSLTDGAIGRAFLAGLPEAERNTLLNLLRVQDPERAHLLPARVQHALEDYERNGFCTALAEVRPGIYAVAAPVRQAVDGNRFAFTCAIAAGPDTQQLMASDYGPRLVRMVDAIEAALQTRQRMQDNHSVLRADQRGRWAR